MEFLYIFLITEQELFVYGGLSKVAGCWRKSPPTWLVSASYSAWHFFTDGVFQIKYPLTLTTQPSTSKLSDSPGMGKGTNDLTLY